MRRGICIAGWWRRADPGRLIVNRAGFAGGAGGIGAAVARLLGSRGAKVALLDLVEESAAAKARELADDGMQAMGVPVNVRRRADVSRALDAVVARFGPIDIVVNNAAVVVVDGHQPDWMLRRGTGGAPAHGAP